MLILIVDDVVEQAESLELLFRNSPECHATKCAPTVEGAKLLAKVHPPDAVVLDLAMPQGGGKEFLEWLRGQERFRRVPVVVVTGLDPQDVPDLSGLEPFMMLVKPYEPDELMRAIEAMRPPTG